MKKHIPNFLTGMNVVSGMMAVFMGMYGNLEMAAIFILIGMVFDFFDGMVARLLHVKSELGKELDSLADVVSFGVAPAILAHLLMKDVLFGGHAGCIRDLSLVGQILVFVPLLIPFFSAFRLAKFNLDKRQTMSFIGMPVPAHALFWVGLVFASLYIPEVYAVLFGNIWVLAAGVVILSLLLVSELPMFSLKITDFSWKANYIRYIYFLCLLLIAVFFGLSVILCVIPLYILFCAVDALLHVSAGK